MARIEYIEICGKEYPLSFSLMAQKAIAAKYGSLENLQEKMSALDEEGVDALAYFIEVLIMQGCAYKNYFEKDIPAPPKASVENGEWEPITQEEIMIGLQFSELTEILNKVVGAVTKANEREVIAEDKEKNTVPTQA